MNFTLNNNAAKNAANVIRPAQALLIEAGLAVAWEVYQTPDITGGQEEATIRDMVWKLEQKGTLSDKQVNYLRILVERIARRYERAAQWAAESQDAAPVPTGRLTFTGEVLTVKEVYSQFGPATKLLLKTADGWKAWGTCPRALELPAKGDTVTLTATLEPSKDDAKFGFFSRPTGATLTRRAGEAN